MRNHRDMIVLLFLARPASSRMCVCARIHFSAHSTHVLSFFRSGKSPAVPAEGGKGSRGVARDGRKRKKMSLAELEVSPLEPPPVGFSHHLADGRSPETPRS